MDPIRNPYAPGAGQRPPELAGRDAQLRQFDVVLERVARGRPERSIVNTGLRGVGKTVLLNAMRSQAVRAGWGTGKLEARPDQRLRESHRSRQVSDRIRARRPVNRGLQPVFIAGEPGFQRVGFARRRQHRRDIAAVHLPVNEVVGSNFRRRQPPSAYIRRIHRRGCIQNQDNRMARPALPVDKRPRECPHKQESGQKL